MPDEPQDHLRNEEAEVIRKEEVVDIYAALLDKISWAWSPSGQLWSMRSA
jgi:2-phosphoglycerate kinase